MMRQARACCRIVCHVALMTLVALSGTSCCTAQLWDKYNPDTRLWIPADKTTEEDLQKKNIKYERIKTDDMDGHFLIDGYFVDKSREEKDHDRLILTVATPFTVAADAVIITIVVGGVVCYLYASVNDDAWHEPPSGPRRHRRK